MKTKLFTLFLALVASVGTLFAQSGTCGENLTWNLTDGVLTISGTGVMTDFEQGSVPWYSYRENITSVIIGNSVTSIGDNAFASCSSLTSVTIPNSVTSIGYRAFVACRGLKSITIPNNVTSIGRNAFSSCSGLTSVTIGNSVTSIGNTAFYNCSGLTSVHISDLAAWCGITFGDANSNPLYYAKHLYLNDTEITDLTIPNSVTSIGSFAFYGCSGLTSVTIPNNVTSIGNWAFDGVLNIVYNGSASGSPWGARCVNGYVENSLVYEDATKTNLISCSLAADEIVIPNSVTSIGEYAFSGCSGITSVTIPNSVTSIGNYAFYNCTGLTSITIPNSVTSIGERAFYNCSGLPIENNIRYADTYLVATVDKSLSAYTIKEGTKWIGCNAFYGCSSLTSLTIPNSVTSIEIAAFSNCTGLTSITIPNSVTSIGQSAFYKCSGLTSVTIGNSVTSIGDHAFYGCSSLTSVTMLSETPPAIYYNTFDYGVSISIYVPCGSLNAYQSSWSNYASLIKYESLPYTISVIVNNSDAGHVNYPQGALTICDNPATIEAVPNYGYHFTQWSDGNTDNPRTIELTQDTTLEAEFAKNTYTISTTSANPEWGTTAGGKSALYLDEVEILATANYGYHFVKWNDNNTENPRTVSVTEDKTYTATFAKNVYYITKNAEHGSISGNSSAKYLDEVTLSVSSDYGYHFSQWSDGNTDNPRTIVLTQDTTFTAEFAKNTYTISTTSANPEWGTTAGGKSALYMDEVEISATANYGYHFVHWSDREYICDDWWDGVCYYGHWGDYNTEPTRTIVVERDSAISATFAKNVYSITKNAEHGTISGNSSAEYLDYVTLTATPDYGYHFTQWSDGLKDNPRIFRLTQDTTFTAEFAYDRVGQCGKDLALVWSYDPANKVLTIGNAGEFTENMQFGVEAPTEMEELVIGNNVTAIGENAFAGISTLKKVSIGESVKTIYDRAFYNCVNLETIFNYRPTPTNAYSTAFDGVDKFECALYVLPNSIDLYKSASVWRDFYYTYAIGATAATVNEVSVTPAVNTAAVAWPAVENAFTYELVIKDKSGNIVCTLVFNANGQLTAIAFAAPGRAQASTQATGFSFTITGLDSGTGYDLTINAKDDQGQVISTTTQSFTTASDITTGIDATTDTISVRKQMINGQLYILRDGKTYTVQGQLVK